ncbi:MAG TPA: flagellar GTP-binding protein [Planctomycetota bacterium]|nr:flagellar GTP-binding protein [Planctomycetota bacterium]
MRRVLGADPESIELLGVRHYREGGFLGFGGAPVCEITARRVPPRRGAGAAVAEEECDEQPPRPPSRTAGGFLARAYGAAARSAERSSPRPPAPPAPDCGGAVAASAADIGSLHAELAAVRAVMEQMCRRQAARHQPNVCPELFDGYLRLVEAQVAEGLAKTLVERVQRDLGGAAQADSVAVRAHLLTVLSDLIRGGGPIRLKPGRAVTVALIGPTGVGKTTTVAKLAARFALLERKRVALVTNDTYRLAAVDQLYRYGELMHLPVREVSSPAKVRAVLDEFRDFDLVLIDTAGRSQRDDLKMNDLRLFLEAARPDETHLVLSSTSESGLLSSVVERFSRFKVDRVLLTKLDETVSLGVLLNVLLRIDKQLSYVTTGQGVPDDIEVGDGRKLAGMLIGEAAQSA